MPREPQRFTARPPPSFLPSVTVKAGLGWALVERSKCKGVRHGRGWDGGNVCQGLGGLGGRRSRPASPVWMVCAWRNGVGPWSGAGEHILRVPGGWQLVGKTLARSVVLTMLSKFELPVAVGRDDE